MAHAEFHSRSSVKQFGGKIEDYLPIHQAMDSMKLHVPDNRHRVFYHHMGIVPIFELAFGKIVDGQRMTYITNSDGKDIPIQYIVLQHIKEDSGTKDILSAKEILEGIGLLSELQLPAIMYKTARKLSKEFDDNGK